MGMKKGRRKIEDWGKNLGNGVDRRGSNSEQGRKE